MFDSERTAIGLRLIDLGEVTMDVATDFGQAWDPNRESGIGQVPQVAGNIMVRLGNRILPQVEEK